MQESVTAFRQVSVMLNEVRFTLKEGSDVRRMEITELTSSSKKEMTCRIVRTSFCRSNRTRRRNKLRDRRSHPCRDRPPGTTWTDDRPRPPHKRCCSTPFLRARQDRLLPHRCCFRDPLFRHRPKKEGRTAGTSPHLRYCRRVGGRFVPSAGEWRRE